MLFCFGIGVIQLDEWTQELCNGLNFHKKENFHHFVTKLDDHLRYRSYLVGYFPSSVDLSLYQLLYYCHDWHKMKETIQVNHGAFNLLRYYNTMANCSLICNATDYLSKEKEREAQSASKGKNKSKDGSVTTSGIGGKGKGGKGGGKKGGSKNGGGKAVTGSWNVGIGDEWKGKVVTRFPPEPSGYLHIGHAKAAFMNREIADQFDGKMLIRLDDTNPSKEKGEFVESILRDLNLLGIRADTKVTHTSDYFDVYIKYCKDAIKKGHAFADETPREEMKEQRMARMESLYRNRSVKENLEMWQEMIDGTDKGQKCCIRIKLDMKSDNGTLRDPVIYRCNTTDFHHNTG